MPMTNHDDRVNAPLEESQVYTRFNRNDQNPTQDVIHVRSVDTLDVQTSADEDPLPIRPSPRITVTFHNLTKVINVPAKMIDPSSKQRYIQRILLDNVAGQIHPGQIVALMGPSGSGKTTLLNTLAGRALSGVTGNVWFNNQSYDKSMKRKLAYVLQQDLFFEALTVRQQLVYTALLRLPNTMTRKEKIAQADTIIDSLRIRKCANTPIMLVSGGEKKRVNIGTELLTNPSVIFLDEPTSGLDSTSAVVLIEALRELANVGKTIITSIHQPSSQIFQSFDQLILLADGKTIFMGKPSDALAYFATLGHHSPPQYNPADYVMDLVNQDLKVREELKEAYAQNKKVAFAKKISIVNIQREDCVDGSQYLSPEPSGKESDLSNPDNVNLIRNKSEGKWPIGFFAQFFVLFSRCFTLTGKEQFTILAFMQTMGLAIISGLCWLQMDRNETSIPDRASFIYFVLTFWPIDTLYVAILAFPFERTVIQKERDSGSFRLSAYFIGKSFAEAPLKVALPMLYFIIAYWMANINPNFGVFLAMLAFQLLAVLVTESIGFFLGAVFKNVNQAITAANVFVLGLMLLGGFFVKNLPKWLSVWAKWLSFFKYAYDACLRLEFMGGHTYKCVDGSYIDVCRNNINGTFTGDDALQFYNVDLSVGLNFTVLFSMFVAIRFLAYLALRFINNTSGRI